MSEYNCVWQKPNGLWYVRFRYEGRPYNGGGLKLQKRAIYGT
jgi:hypothetical protein